MPIVIRAALAAALLVTPAIARQQDPSALFEEGRQFFASGQSEYNAAGEAQQRGDTESYCDNLRAAYLDFDKAKNRFYGASLAASGSPGAAREGQKAYSMAYDAREQAKKAFEARCS